MTLDMPKHPKPTVIVYEVLIAPESHTHTTGAVPLTIDNENPEWRELQAYTEIYRKGLFRNADFVGVISPKFSNKAKIQFAEFVDFIQANPDCDVCFINPFPQLAYWSLNVWMQGEHAHPGIIGAAQRLLKAAQIPLELDVHLRHGEDILLYCNFWVGNEWFWENYVGKILMPVVKLLESAQDLTTIDNILETTHHTDPAPYLPFIIERLFSTFLATTPDTQKAWWQHSLKEVQDDYCSNDFERMLVSGMAHKINALGPTTGKWEDKAIAELDFLSSLFQRHFQDFYEHRPHPHTGRTFRPIY